MEISVTLKDIGCTNSAI